MVWSPAGSQPASKHYYYSFVPIPELSWYSGWLVIITDWAARLGEPFFLLLQNDVHYFHGFYLNGAAAVYVDR